MFLSALTSRTQVEGLLRNEEALGGDTGQSQRCHRQGQEHSPSWPEAQGRTALQDCMGSARR